MKEYWYEYFEYCCPVCGAEAAYKYRVYDKPRPEKWEDRHHYEEHYDSCLEWTSLADVL